uniref:Transient receptor ion channel domain-containing protein n=1 Tax=Timema cristinae TaxID=61476 RepID=A0A7R9DDH8_TIMCR|nr:unnamed protein product [Timema cristinae]
MVEFLLHQKRLDIRDCALHAVRENQPRILGMILDRLKETSPVLEFVGFTHSAEFPDYITPLILAAQCGHYEIIEMLLERNHSITRPHPPRCLCSQVCRRILKEEDALHVATAKLEVYRAISNPAYLCQSSDDPILMAFQLFKELHQCATIHQEFRAAYTQLSRECRTFAVELLGAKSWEKELDILSRGYTYPHMVILTTCADIVETAISDLLLMTSLVM